MTIAYHPKRGSILICDFSGLNAPEMIKRRPVIVISPQIKERKGLCTIVALSTTMPNPIKDYHYELHMNPVLPAPYDSQVHWVKGDMIYTFSYTRFDLPYRRDSTGKREYLNVLININDMEKVEQCILLALGIK
jgi:mRNA interferase MazF